MHLTELMSREDLRDAVLSGDVVEKKHPYYRLSIYTYTNQCQYKGNWTNVTLNCRGLIVDETTGNIVARPYPKFFNYSQHGHGQPYAPDLPDEAFRIYEKLDGSLGIIFHYAGKWLAASKGSFMSEQAVWAQKQLDDGYWDDAINAVADDKTRSLIPGFTYLCEIIYPANRIVVDYGDLEAMILTGVYGPDGKERLLTPGFRADWSLIGPTVKEYEALPFSLLVEMAESNIHEDGPAQGTDHEGYVLRYASGLRVKIKYGEYIRLHKVLTGISARDVWKALACELLREVQEPKYLAMTLHCSLEEVKSLLSSSRPLDGVLENVPDEFYQWVTDICDGLMFSAGLLTGRILAAWDDLSPLLPDNPQEFAEQARKLDEPVCKGVFTMKQGKPIAPVVWSRLRPAADRPFRQDDE